MVSLIHCVRCCCRCGLTRLRLRRNCMYYSGRGGWTELQLMYHVFPWAIFWTALSAPFLDDMNALRAFHFTAEAVLLLMLSSLG